MNTPRISFSAISLFASLTAAAMAVSASAAPADQSEAKKPDAKDTSMKDDKMLGPCTTPCTTASGLTIEDLTIGSGPACTPGGAVIVNCKGSLASGEVFFDTAERGGPIGFALAGVIPGWQEGIPGMQIGGKRRLIIPPDLAYGVQGRPPAIPPNSTLTFDVEVVDMLVIKDEVVGEGTPCPEGATVTIHYKGTLEDGTVFDSTTPDAPATFPLMRLIDGWKIGIPGMKPGGKRTLVIPYQFAYGEAGRPPVIPAKAKLTFEIELIGFK